MKLDLSQAHNANFKASLKSGTKEKEIRGYITVFNNSPVLHWTDDNGVRGHWSLDIAESTFTSFSIEPRDPKDFSQVRKGDILWIPSHNSPDYNYNSEWVVTNTPFIEVREIWGNIILAVGKSKLDAPDASFIFCNTVILDILQDTHEILLSEAEQKAKLLPIFEKGEVVWARKYESDQFSLAIFREKVEGGFKVSFTSYDEVTVKEVKKLELCEAIG